MKRYLLILFTIILLAAGLRLYKLGQNPPSLYWDEASLGYNAYAILTTGHDEHGEILPITRFIAFGDYKPPGYIYAIVPFMAIFGSNEFAIRFPSALSGIIMVLLTYFLAKRLTKNELTGLSAAFLLAISPWSLQLSRVAFEAHLGALFNLIGVMLFIFARKKAWLFPLSFIFFIASFYTFNANRIISPMMICFLVIIYWRDLFQVKKWIFISIVISFILIWPNFSYFQTRESRLRFEEVSIFNNLDTIIKSNDRIARDGNSLWAKIIHNRRVYYAKDFLIHYFHHFQGDFLFITGDRNPRLSVQSVGELYLFELPFLIIGIYLLIKQRTKTTAVLFGWLLIAPVPAAMAKETPHMLRIASIIPVYQIIAGIGFTGACSWFLKQQTLIKKLFKFSLLIIIIVNVFYYLHNYWIHYPVKWSGEWQYGYKQMVEKVMSLETHYDRISVSPVLGRPYIYFLLYGKIDPTEYLKIRRAQRDWYGFWNVDGFGKYDFTQMPPQPGEKVLKVGPLGTFANSGTGFEQIRDPGGKIIFEIGEP